MRVERLSSLFLMAVAVLLSEGPGLCAAEALNAAPPVIRQQPRDQMIACGSSATFTVGVAGAEPFSYQWRHNGADLPGATGPTLVIPVAQPADAGMYGVRVSNSGGSVNSFEAMLELLPGAPLRLTVSLNNSNVFIRWPNNCAEYDLLETPSLGLQTQWMPSDASVLSEGPVYIARTALQRTGNRFFRLALRPSAGLPAQPPEIPEFEYTEYDPTPIGATNIRPVPWEEIPGSLDDAMKREIRFAAEQNPLVRGQLGQRYAHLNTSTLELDKETQTPPGEPLQTLVTFFSHSFNWTVLVNMSGTTVAGVSNTTVLQPPEGADEVAEARALASRDPRLADRVQGLVGGGLLVVVENPNEPGYGDRVIYVTFARPEEAAPRFVAIVDLTRQEVISVSSP
jgi:hypothetical protein